MHNLIVTIQPSAPRPPILGVTNGYSPRIGGRGLNSYTKSKVLIPIIMPIGGIYPLRRSL